MKDRLLAKRYAKALLAAIPDPATVERAGEFLTAIASAMHASPEFRDVLLNPAIPRHARRAVLEALTREREAPPVMGAFLAVVAEQGRSAGAILEKDLDGLLQHVAQIKIAKKGSH